MLKKAGRRQSPLAPSSKLLSHSGSTARLADAVALLVHPGEPSDHFDRFRRILFSEDVLENAVAEKRAPTDSGKRPLSSPSTACWAAGQARVRWLWGLMLTKA